MPTRQAVMGMYNFLKLMTVVIILLTNYRTEDFTNSVSNTISVPEETAINQNKNEISVIYSENDDYQPVQDTEELEFSEIEGNALLANDLVDIIIESLSMENTIAVDEIKKLVSEPFSIYVEDIFVKLSKMLDLEDVCNLGHILCSFENYDISRIISLYYKHLLFPKVVLQNPVLFV